MRSALLQGFVSHSLNKRDQLKNDIGRLRTLPEYGAGSDSGVDYLVSLSPHLWAIALAFFGFGDLLTTGIGLTFEHAVEVGPLASIVYYNFGFLAMFPLKVITLLLAYIFWRVVPKPHNSGVPLGLAVFGVLVTIWNLSILVALLS